MVFNDIRQLGGIMETQETYQKLRGGYYTPSHIAKYICDWAVSNETKSVLEPSCGDGVFIKSLVERFEQLDRSESVQESILGIELDPVEANKASLDNYIEIINSDFFSYYQDDINTKKKFDAIVGNPPFIRYQTFNKEYRDIAFRLMNEKGMFPNKLTNIWIPFLVLCSYALEEDGRLGMVIPAELFQVDYAGETRKFLSDYFDNIVIITFEELLFEGAQQEVVVLLASKQHRNKGIEVIELAKGEDINRINLERLNPDVKQLDHTKEKWTKYFLSSEEINLLRKVRECEELTLTTELFELNVGVVTGQNKFFVLNESVSKEYHLCNDVKRIIGRAEQVKGLFFEEEDWKKLKDDKKNVYMFKPALDDGKLSSGAQQYIEWGEEEKYHSGYKCQQRKQWYIVPETWQPEAFMLRQIHTFPKLILNNTDATTTDTLHKVRFLEGIEGEYVAGAFINSLTFAMSEIIGRSYGGGVLTFEPGEVRKMLIPMRNARQLNLNWIDHNLRTGNINEILEENDRILLEEGCGFTKDEVDAFRRIWIKLRDRRINRKKVKK